MNRRYKHLFFDLDDTLYDFSQCAWLSLNELFVEQKLDVIFDSFDHFYSIYSVINQGLWDDYKTGKVSKDTVKYDRFILPLQNVGCNNEPLGRFMAEEFLNKCTAKNILVDGAKELISQLAPHYKMHIISNGFVEVQYRKLIEAGIESYFTHVTLSEQVKANKPMAAIFDHAVKCANARKRESLMIGDSYEADVLGAKNAGIDQVYFAYSGTIPENNLATFTITKLEQLRGILL